MAPGVLRSWRMLLAAVAALAVVTVVPATALARDTFDVTGTVDSKNEAKETIIFFTDDLGVKNQPITIDMSNLRSAFRALRDGQSATIEIARRESDTFKAFSIQAEGSYVERADLGAREEFETKGSSIKAHVRNVPEDDEALSQQHRDSNLQRHKDNEP